jgi:hypothetical protein
MGAWTSALAAGDTIASGADFDSMVPRGESAAAGRERELARLRALAEAAQTWARWRRGSVEAESPEEHELLEALDAHQAAGGKEGREQLVLCSGCRRGRDGSDWMALEQLLAEKSSFELTPGMCPDCMARLYPRHLAEPD